MQRNMVPGTDSVEASSLRRGASSLTSSLRRACVEPASSSDVKESRPGLSMRQLTQKGLTVAQTSPTDIEMAC